MNMNEELKNIQRKYSDLINYIDDDPNAPIDPLTYRDSGGDTLLHIAAFRGDVETVRVLLRAGLDVNMRGDMSYTPLHYAYQEGHTDVVEVLLSHGASICLRNEFGKQPGE